MRNDRAHKWIALFALIVIGVCLRLYRLDLQSIWLDEYPNVLYLDAPDFSTYLFSMQVYLPEQAQAPLYYLLMYFWAQWVGMSLYVLRLLPLIMGMTAVPLLYLVGEYAYNKRVALIAALCLTLSPQHIWHAQEIRPYSMLTPLCLLSLYGLLRALDAQDRKHAWRWWSVNLAANVLLAWTQILTVLVPVTEAVFLLLFHRQKLTRWCAAHVALLLPWVAWVLRMPASYTAEFRDVFTDVTRMLKDLFADEVVSMHTDLLPAWKTNPVSMVEPAIQRLLPVRVPMDVLLALILSTAVLYMCVCALRPLLRRSGAASQEDRDHASHHVLFLLLMVLPVLLLWIGTMLTRMPLESPMYSMYNSVAAYLAVGLLLARLSTRLRHIAIAAVVLLYGYQLAIFLPGTTRANWREAAKYLRVNAAPSDRVFDFEYFWPGNYLGYYLSDSDLAIQRVTSLQQACERADEFLTHSPQTGEASHAWLIFERVFIDWLYPAYNLDQTLTKALSDRGLSYELTAFPGHYNLILLRLSREATPPETTPLPVPPFRPIDFEHLAQTLGIPSADPEESARTVAALRSRISLWPPMNKFFLVVYPMDALADGDAVVAEALARYTVRTYPKFGLGYFALGLSLIAKGDIQGAEEQLQESYRLLPGLAERVGPFVDAVSTHPDQVRAAHELERLRKIHFVFWPTLERLTRSFSRPSGA